MPQCSKYSFGPTGGRKQKSRGYGQRVASFPCPASASIFSRCGKRPSTQANARESCQHANAFKGSAVKKSSNILTIAASVVAVISTLGMIGLLVSMDDSSAREAVTLAKKVDKLQANEEFYLGLKKKLEDENKELVESGKSLAKEKDELAATISSSMEDIEDLKNQLKEKDRELSQAKDDIIRAQRISPQPEVVKTPVEKPMASKSLVEEALSWSKTHTTLVFPL